MLINQVALILLWHGNTACVVFNRKVSMFNLDTTLFVWGGVSPSMRYPTINSAVILDNCTVMAYHHIYPDNYNYTVMTDARFVNYLHCNGGTAYNVTTKGKRPIVASNRSPGLRRI